MQCSEESIVDIVFRKQDPFLKDALAGLDLGGALDLARDMRIVLDEEIPAACGSKAGLSQMTAGTTVSLLGL